MSVLIKGMDMPKGCHHCPFTYSTRFKEKKCIFCNEATSIRNKLHDCPLVNVPTPHGDLIDRDALQQRADAQPCFWEGIFDECLVRDAPTIIEAEE